MNPKKAALDPFRAILGALENQGDSDALQATANSSGLVFDTALSGRDDVSSKTRIRALVPRILSAYEALDDQSQLAVAGAAVASIGPLQAVVQTALERIGWALRDNELVVNAPDVRQMFFPKGSPWDAYVILKGIFAEAAQGITVVDAYAEGTVFEMLAARPLDALAVRILCSHYAARVAGEAKRFITQHPAVTVEVRQSRDFHDRFIVLDGRTCVHLGASIKDAGKTAFMIIRLEDQGSIAALLSAITTTWEEANPVE